MQIHGIGELILRTREERGISQKELACGLCEQQKLSSIEMGNDLPDTFLLEAFMSRMGKSADKLEYIISEEEYKFYVLRDSIEEALAQEQYREVEQKLAEYEGYLMEEDVLHFQYLDMVQAFLVWTELCLFGEKKASGVMRQAGWKQDYFSYGQIEQRKKRSEVAFLKGC